MIDRLQEALVEAAMLRKALEEIGGLTMPSKKGYYKRGTMCRIVDVCTAALRVPHRAPKAIPPDERTLPMKPAEEDELYYQAIRAVVAHGQASTSILHRRLRIGFGRAARLLDLMMEKGDIGPADKNYLHPLLVKKL